jgi:hypothetical protein
MATYLIHWPDNDIKIVEAGSEVELFDIIDEIADPFCAEIYKITGRLNLTILHEKDKEGNKFYEDRDSCKCKRFKFKDDVFERWLGLPGDVTISDSIREMCGVGRNDEN